MKDHQTSVEQTASLATESLFEPQKQPLWETQMVERQRKIGSSESTNPISASVDQTQSSVSEEASHLHVDTSARSGVEDMISRRLRVLNKKIVSIWECIVGGLDGCPTLTPYLAINSTGSISTKIKAT